MKTIKLYSTGEVAKKTGLSKATIKVWCNKGDIEFIKEQRGKHLHKLITQKGLEAILEKKSKSKISKVKDTTKKELKDSKNKIEALEKENNRLRNDVESLREVIENMPSQYELDLQGINPPPDIPVSEMSIEEIKQLVFFISTKLESILSIINRY